jgi:hypothetical protein
MAIFSLSRSAVTMNTANDMLTIIAAASRKLKVIDFIVGGNGATSAAAAFCEVGLYLSTGGTTGSAALTPKKWETDEPTQGFTNFTAWVAQPTLSGDPYYRFPFNNYGGAMGKPIKPIGEIILRNSEQLSIRPISGSSAVTFTIVVDET